MTERHYTEAHMLIRNTADITQAGEILVHTHRLTFARSLTRAEQHLLVDVLVGWYYTVHFSHQFGDGLVAEPVVEFLSDQVARYTLRQRTMSGPWKDLLFAVLAHFSAEVAPICLHDESRAFDPTWMPLAVADEAVRGHREAEG